MYDLQIKIDEVGYKSFINVCGGLAFFRFTSLVTHGRINQENHSVCGFAVRQVPEGRILAGLS